MADEQQTILINFEVNDTQLEDTIETLLKTGQIGKEAADTIRASFKKIDDGVTEGTKGIDVLKAKLKEMLKVGGEDVKLGIAGEGCSSVCKRVGWTVGQDRKDGRNNESQIERCQKPDGSTGGERSKKYTTI